LTAVGRSTRRQGKIEETKVLTSRILLIVSLPLPITPGRRLTLLISIRANREVGPIPPPIRAVRPLGVGVDAVAEIAPVRHFAVLGAVVADAPRAVAAGREVGEGGRRVDSADFAVHAGCVDGLDLVHGAEFEGWVRAGGVAERHFCLLIFGGV